MLRYLRLFLCFLRFSTSRALEFRFDFFFRIFMDVFYYLMSIFFYKIVYLHTATVGGWTESQAMIFVGVFITVDALQMTFLAQNMMMIPFFVNRGDLDYYLVRPVSSLFFLSLRDVALNSVINLGMALGILVWALSSYDGPVTVGLLCVLFLGMALGFWLMYCMRLLSIMPVFWTHSGVGLSMLYWSFLRFAERPLPIFSPWLRVLLLTLLPFGFIASVPAAYVFDGIHWDMLGMSVLVCVIYGVLILWLWKICLKQYSSASS